MDCNCPNRIFKGVTLNLTSWSISVLRGKSQIVMRGTPPALQIVAENFPQLVAKVASCQKMDIVHQVLIFIHQKRPFK